MEHLGFEGFCVDADADAVAPGTVCSIADRFERFVAEWEMSIPRLADRADETAGRIGQTAWRYESGTAEIAGAMEDAGLSDGFHDATREICRRLADLRESGGDIVEDVKHGLLGQ